MTDLIWKLLKADKAGLAGAFAALFAASALLSACGLILQSGLGAGVSAERYAAADVVVSGPDSVRVTIGGKSKTKPLTEPATLPSSLLKRVAAVPGVRAAIPDRGFPVDLITGDGASPATTGHGWSTAPLAPFTLAAGHAPGPGEVVLEIAAGLRPGDRVTVVAGTAAPTAYRVAGIVRGDLRRPLALFQDAEATRLYGKPQELDAIGVLAQPGTDSEELAERLKEALGDSVTVSTGEARSRAEFGDVRQARSDLQEMAASLIGSVVVIAGLVLTGALSLTAHRRRRQIALLRAVGASSRHITRMIAAETAAVALLAGLLGCLPGGLLAALLLNALRLVGLAPDDFAISVGPIPALAAVGACLLISQAAAWAVSRRVLRPLPAQALTEVSVEPPRLSPARITSGVLLLITGIGASSAPVWWSSVFAVAIAASGGLIMIIALSVLGPPIMRLGTRMLAGRLRRTYGAAGYLATANSLANSRRLAGTVSPMILAIGFALLQLGLPATTASAAQRDLEAGTLATHTLTGGEWGLPPGVSGDVRKLPGVRAATPVVRTRVYAAISLLDSPEVLDYQAQAVDPAGLSGTVDLGVEAGSLAGLRPGTVAISRAAAGTLSAKIGSMLHLYLGDGTPYQPEVVAIYSRGSGFGDLTLPRAVVPRSRDDAVLVRADPSANLGALARAHPGLMVSDGAAMRAAQEEGEAAAMLGGLIPLLLVFGYLAMSVANALMLAVTERTREFALLRLAGGSRGQVMRMLRAESVLIVTLAVIIGTAAPLLPLAMIAYGLVGLPLPAIQPVTYLAVVGATSALGVLSVLVPARIALRTRPIQALSGHA
ncbi:FtsX-like permease family protein [Microtetraspora malaysiensis]|uniref:FtsX-like permease family protein n=1 Tax=Microtetraspora malaysiensis TaxID=161358 RepID=UPI003D8CA39F